MIDTLRRGTPGSEVTGMGFNMNHPRRRSNSFHASYLEYKTKFETIEPEPVLEDEMLEDIEAASYADSQNSADMASLDQVDSATSQESVEDADEAKKL